MRRNRFLLVATILLALLHAYIGMRLLPGLYPWIQSAGIAFLAASTLLIPLGLGARFVIETPDLADRISGVGGVAMGLFSSLLVLTVLRDLLLLTPLDPTWIPAAVVPVSALAMSLIGYINARRPARIVDVAIPIDGLPRDLDGFILVQISDIHVGPTIKNGYLQAVVDRVNRLHPDLIAITGDVVDGEVERLADHTAPLAGLHARHGVFVVTGNHEYYSGVEQWVAEFRRLGLSCLRNEHRVVQVGDAQLIVAGVEDYNAGSVVPGMKSDPVAALAGAPRATSVLLAHQPRSALAAAEAGFDLQLSGHTHGGQFWPWNHFVRLQQPYTAGLHRLGKLWVYTSRGTGYWGPPKRFGAPSEITRLTLIATSNA